MTDSKQGSVEQQNTNGEEDAPAVQKSTWRDTARKKIGDALREIGVLLVALGPMESYLTRTHGPEASTAGPPDNPLAVWGFIAAGVTTFLLGLTLPEAKGQGQSKTVKVVMGVITIITGIFLAFTFGWFKCSS